MNTKTFQTSGIQRFLVVFTLLLFTVALTPTVSEAAYSTGNPVADQLLDIAQTKLDGEYKALISGKAEDMTTAQVSLKGKASEKVKEVTDTQLRRNKGLAEHGQHYTKFSSKLTIEKSDITNDSATITVKENVVLTLNNDGSKDPVYTKEKKIHTFHFIRQDEGWSVDEDKEVNELLPVTPEEGVQRVTDKPFLLNAPKNNPANNKVTSISDIFSLFGLIKPALAASGTFNPTNAVNYARSYWGPNNSNYNTAYRAYGNDCTNFVSQALNWGGWQHIGGWYDDAHYWWYSPSVVVGWGGRAESRSWISTQHFYWFARYSNRAHNAATLSDFRPGDVMQIDQATPDGYLDHTEIVSKKDSSGNIYLTSHSYNVLDRACRITPFG